MKRTTKAAAVLLTLVMVVFALTGCTKTQQGITTLYDTNGLKVEREGVETRIYDLKGSVNYTFTSHRVRAARGTAAQISEAKTAADTDTLIIKTVYGLVIVTEKATGKTIYIR